MFKRIIELVSEGYELISSVFGESESTEITEEIQQFITFVVEKDYINASIYLIDSLKDGKKLELDDLVLEASNMNVDLHDMHKVIDVITESVAENAKPDFHETKAIQLLHNVLTYTN